MSSQTVEVERRALELFERLTYDTLPGTPDAVLANESPEVRARVAELMARVGGARAMLPTEFPETPPVAPPPERIGPFRLVEILGSGGMGQVWRAERVEGGFDQIVAIKLIHAERFSEEAVRRFDAERRILARLDHPGIARILDGGLASNGQPWLALEYVDALPLDDYVTDHAAALEQRVALLRRVCEAVQAAHARLVVHADLKPANILVRSDGMVKLLDFGIARLIGEGDVPEAVNPFTRAYASPKRLEGAPPTVADDVFALGIMLRNLNEANDADLAAVADRAADPDEARRYGSVEAFAVELARWEGRFPVEARPAQPMRRAQLFFRRHRIWVLITAGVIAALLALTIVASVSWYRAVRARAEADARFGEVRSLAHYMLFDLYDELANAPGTAAVRADLAKKGGTYLDRLRLARVDSADLMLEVAGGYRRLAVVQGVNGQTSLGESSAAIASLDKAEAMLREALRLHPNNAGLHEELGWVLGYRWTQVDDAGAGRPANLASRRAFERALALEPGRPASILGVLASEKNEGYDLIWANQPKQALPVLERALARIDAFRPPASLVRDTALLKVSILNRIGDATYYNKDIPGSLAWYYRAKDLVDVQLARRADTPVWLNREGEVEWNISGTLNDSGHPKEALVAADRGIVALRRVLSYGPDSNSEKQLLILYNQKATVLQTLGRVAEAVEPVALSVALREKRLRDEPEDATRLRDLTVGLAPYAEILGRSGRLVEACQRIDQATILWRRILKNAAAEGIDRQQSIPDYERVKNKYCPSK